MSAALPYAEVIGDPIVQSKSPVIHSYWLGLLGIAADYRATHVTLPDLAAFVAERRTDRLWCGCNVTMPHKQAVIPLLDRLDPLAARIGAVNTIVPEDGALVGYNTDVPGFLEPLAGRRFERALVLGNGGAARAIVAALHEHGAALVLAGRDPARAQALLDELVPSDAHLAASLARFAVAPPPGQAGFDLVVNATALGMVGHDPLVVDPRWGAPGAVFYDIVTSPPDTLLLRQARAANHATVDGLAMLIGQADHAFRRFFGQQPPRGEADRGLRERLSSVPAATASLPA